MIKKIAVIGGTGMLGKPVVKQLTQSQFAVSVLARNAATARTILPETVTVVEGDIKNENNLDNFLQGQDGLYINLNLKPGEKRNDFHAETDGLKKILDAAKKARIRRVAFISSVVMRYQGMNGFNWWVFDMKMEAVRLVKASGIPYTIFYPSTFMDNFVNAYRRGNRILLAGTSEQPMYFISGDDYGKQVAKSFQILSGNDNREYVVQGPQAFTADEAAKEFAKHYTSAKLTIAHAPLGILRLLSIFSRQISYGVHIVEALNKYPEKFEAENTWRELGQPSTTLSDYAAQVSG